MRVYKLQRFRGRWAIATYIDGKRISRRQLPATSAAEASGQFQRLVAEFQKPPRVTIAWLWNAFREDRAGRPVAATMGYERKAVLAHFGDMAPEDITDATCRAYTRLRRAAGRHDGTIWTELGHLRTALRWAERSGFILKAPAIERPPKPPPKDRHLTRDEAEELLAAAIMPHVRLFIILAITTAARASALLDLTWDRCDVERGRIYLGNPETIRPLKGRATVPMNDTARAALAAAKEGARTNYVIEWAGDRVRKIHGGVVTAARRAGLAGVTPHALRHTAAVWMAEHGTPMSEIAQYLGHADSRITERVYSRFSPEYLRKASQALELAGPHSVNRLATGSRKPLT